MIGLCERFHCLPSQVYAEDAGIFRLLNLYELGRPEREEG